MRVRWSDGAIPTSVNLAAAVRRALDAATRAMTGRVREVAVSLRDLNGPRAGKRDKLCRLVAHVNGAPAVVVQAAAPDYYAASGCAAQRLREALRRAHERRTHRLRRGG